MEFVILNTLDIFKNTDFISCDFLHLQQYPFRLKRSIGQTTNWDEANCMIHFIVVSLIMMVLKQI